MHATATEVDRRHGGAYDRGTADYYYWRPYRPHYFKTGTYTSEEVTQLTDEELLDYNRGWFDAKELGDRKDWR